MANRWIDGFSRYGDDEAKMLNGSSSQAWAEVASNFTLSTDNPRTGSHSLRMVDQTGGGFCRRVFGNTLNEVFFGYSIFCTGLPPTEPTPDGTTTGVILASFRDQANNRQVEVTLGTDGALVAYVWGPAFEGYNGDLLGRSDPIIGAGAYQHLEFYLKVGSADGALEIRVDEVTQLNLTGIDTRGEFGTGDESSQVAFGTNASLSLMGVSPYYFADMYVNDTVNDGSGCHTFVGDCKAGGLNLNGNTATAGFDLSSGASGYELLDERPPNDADYIYTDATTARSDFALESTPANTVEILAVRPWVRASKDDAGTAEVAPNMVSGGVDGTVASQPIATAPAYYDSLVALDPNTGAPWTKTALDAANEIVERTA